MSGPIQSVVPLSQNADGTFGLYLQARFNYNPSEYTLVSQDQLRYRHNQFDGLVDITDRNGVTLEYRDDGIFSSTGESIQFVRDAQDRIIEIIDPSGNSIEYTYSAAGDLITYTDQVDNTWTHDYFTEPAHFLKSITGPRGNVLEQVQYDDDGRFVGLVDGLGNAVAQEYDIENNTFIQTDRNGNVTTLEYDNRGNITLEVDALGGERRYEYNDPANIHLETAITDANGNTTRFEYDSRSNITLLEEPGGVFTRFEYDSFNNVTRIIGPATSDPGDGFADTLIDASFADGFAVGTTARQRLADSEAGLDTDFVELDPAEVVLGAEFDRDNETQLDSDYLLLDAGDHVTFGFDEVVIDRAGDDIFIVTPLFSGSFIDQGETAEVSVTTDGINYISVATLGLEAYAGIDLADAGISGPVIGVRVTALASDDGNDENDFFALTGAQVSLGDDFRVTRNLYDSNGNLIETIDALGNSSFQTNDEFGRPTSITDRRGNTTTLEYGQLIGSPTRVINPDNTTQEFTYDANGRPLTQTNELGVVVQTIVYDELGRQLSISGADGQLTTFEYNGELLASETVTIDATQSQVTTYEYDDNNRLFRQTDGIGAVVELTYDANGNTTSLTDPVGNTTSYVFDALDRQIEETDPLGEITTYGYDAVGNLTERVDRLGRRITFEYDERDRQTAELWFAVDGTLIETSTYTYDIFNNLMTAEDAESSYAYTYDVLDRLVSSDNAGTPDAPNVILTYRYDVDGNRIRVADNSGVTIDSEYGSRNQLLAKTWFGGEVDEARIEYDYDLALRETEARRYSDVDATNLIGRTETVLDDTGRRIRITHLDGSDIVLANYEYEFDQANRITQQTIDNDVVDYTYDLTGQLLTADHSDPSIPDEFYVYDLNGNRIESHLHGSDYVTGPNNQLLSDGEFNYEYDDEGNQVRRTNIETGEITEFEYDHRNRSIRTTVLSSGGISTSESQYVFDVFGRRIAVINDADGAGPGAAVRENFVYDGDNVWADYNEAGEAIARYLFGDSIDSNIARWRVGEGTAWYLADHLGTVRGIVDTAGALVNQTTYDSFGQVLSETNSLFGDRYKFVGRELNSESDYYFRAREYNSGSGRFGSLDPAGFFAGDSNLYRYVENSTLNFNDPTGKIIRPTSLLLLAVVVSLQTGIVISCEAGSPDENGPRGGIAQDTAFCELVREQLNILVVTFRRARDFADPNNGVF